MSISLGSISFALTADTKDLDAAIKRVQSFGTAVSNAARRTGEGARAHEAQLRRQEAAAIKALQSVQKFQDAVGRAGATGSKGFVNTTNSLNKTVKELTSGRLTALEFQRTMERFNVELGNANRQLTTFRHTQQAANAAQRDAARASATQETRLLAQSRAVFTMEQQYAKLAAQVKRVGASPDLLMGPRTALNSARTSLGSGVVPTRTQTQQVQSFTAAINSARIALGDWHRPPRDPGWLSRALDQAAQSAILLHGPLGGVATRLSVLSSMASSVNYGMIIMAASISGAIFGFYKLSSALIDATKKLERAKLGLEAISGSAVSANQDLKWIMEVAMRTGGRFDVLAVEFSKMSAAAKGTNLEGARTRDIFEAIAYASAKLGLSQEDTAGTMRAIQQIMSKGRVQAEELRGQLGDRLPIAVRAMAEALGKSTKELDDFMKKGKVTSEALVPFAEVVKKTLGIDTTKAIDTVVASEGRLYNAFQKLFQNMDKAVGISDAYRNSMNGLASVVIRVADDLGGTLATALSIATGAMLGLFGPAIWRAIVALPPAIGAVTTAVLSLNVAMVANPMGAFLSILLRVGTAVGGAIGAYYTLNSVLSNNEGAFDNGRKTVGEYIKSQEGLKIAIRATTLEFIKQAEALAETANQRVSAQQSIIDSLEKSYGGPSPQTTAMSRMTLVGNAIGYIVNRRHSAGVEQLAQAREEMVKLQEAARAAGVDVAKLREILEKPERLPVGSGIGTGDAKSKSTTRLEVARKNALDTIRETTEAYNNLFKDPAARAWAEIQLDINKKVEDFRDKLTQARLPAEQVVLLTEKYGIALRNLKETEFVIKQHPGIWKTLADVLSRGMDKALDSFVDGIFEGKNALEILRDVAKEVVKDIIKTFMQLAVMNPLKNLLFGSGLPTIGNNTNGVGGLLGSAVNWMMGTGAPAAATGRKVNPGRAYTVGEKGKELFIPDGAGEIIPNNELGNLKKLMSGGTGDGSGGGGGNTYVQVFNENAKDNKVNVQEERRGNDKFVKIMITKLINEGGLDDSMGSRFGVRPRRSG